MIEQEPSFTYNSSQHEASPQHRANIFFLSYRISEGGIGTQNRILLNLEAEDVYNLFDDDGLDDVIAIAHNMIGSYFLNQKLHPATAIPWDYEEPLPFAKTEQLVINEIAGLFERFKDREQLATFDHTLPGIAQSIILMDADYLSRPGGRAGDSQDLMVKVSPYTRDPYDSIFIRYSVLGASTKSDEYDRILHGIGMEKVLRELDPHTIKQLRIITEVYIRKHPGADKIEQIVTLKSLCRKLNHGK